jgi:hypothetical protein
MGGRPKNAWFVVALLTIGCSKETPPPPPAPPATASAPAPVVKPPPALDFHVVVRSPEALKLSSVYPTNFVVASNLVFTISDGKLRQSPELGRGAPKSFIASGRFPDAAWVTAKAEPVEEEATDTEEHTSAFKWTSTGWAKSGLLGDGETIAGIADWGEGRVLALIKMGAYDARFALVGGKGPVALPAPTPYKKPKPESGAAEAAKKPAGPASDASAPQTADAQAGTAAAKPDSAVEAPASQADDAGAREGAKCKTQVHLPVSSGEPLRTLAALPTGEVFRVGYECREDARLVLAVERWQPKQRKSVIDVLPEPPLQTPGAPLILARAPDDAYATVLGATKAWLARLSGGSWKAEALPFTTPITDAVLTHDGVVLLASGAMLYRQEKAGAAWAEIPVPELTSGTIARIHAPAKDEVWLAGVDGAGSNLLLSTRPQPSVIEPPKAAQVAAMQQSNKRSPATAACDRIYVHLYTLGASGAKPPKAFPKISSAIGGDKALSKLEFVVEDDGANTYLGAKAPSLALAQKLAKEIARVDPKVAAQIFCHEPKVKATVTP